MGHGAETTCHEVDGEAAAWVEAAYVDSFGGAGHRGGCWSLVAGDGDVDGGSGMVVGGTIYIASNRSACVRPKDRKNAIPRAL